MQVEIKIHGLKAIGQAMRELPKRIDQKILNDGLLAGARLVRDEAKARVPVLRVADPRRVAGALRRAIHAGRVRPEGYAAKVWVRVRALTKRQIASFKKKSGRSAAQNPNDPFYWRFVEFGTSKMPARPFLRPAFVARREEAVRAAIAVFRDRVQKEIVKLGRERIL